MASNSSWRSHFGLLVSLLIIFVCNFSVADALNQSLCSSQNTGAGSQPGMCCGVVSRVFALLTTHHIVSDDYQSNGKCFDTCKANYAFAVVQAKNCWCSNYVPADTTSIGSCNVPCPGYPFEKCGSSGFFGYVPLNKAPSGTLGASQSQSSTSSPVEPTTSTSLVVSSPGSPYLTSRSSPSSIKIFSSASAIGVGHLSSTTVSDLPSTSQPSRLTTAIPSVSMVLTSFVQTPPTPDPVTIQHTVTRSPSVEVSFVSIVCLFPFLDIETSMAVVQNSL